MTDLLSRLSAATAPSRELDAEIALANGWTLNTRSSIGRSDDEDDYWRSPTGQIRPRPPRYTESVDAAITLVPKGLNWKFSQMHQGVAGSHAWVFGPSSPIMSDVKVWGDCISTPEHRRTSTPAISIVIACLKAREDSKP